MTRSDAPETPEAAEATDEMLARCGEEAAPTGLAALASAVCAVLPQAGLGLPVEEALALGGAAFRTYFFLPADNHAWEAVHPEVRWMEESLRADNYGLLEAIAGHAGVSIRRYAGLSRAEFRALVSHEREEGRWPLLEFDPQELRAPEVVVDVAAGAERWTCRSLGPGGAGGGTWEVPRRDVAALKGRMQGPTSVLVVRPEPSSTPTPRLREALERDMFSWALRHHGCEKELVHHADAFLATGMRAWEVAAARAAELLAEAETAAAFAAFLGRWCAEQERARQAASVWLASGASLYLSAAEAASDAFALSAAGIGALRTQLERLAVTSGGGAGGMGGGKRAPKPRPEALLALSSAFASVRQAEQAAFGELEKALG